MKVTTIDQSTGDPVSVPCALHLRFTLVDFTHPQVRESPFILARASHSCNKLPHSASLKHLSILTSYTAAFSALADSPPITTPFCNEMSDSQDKTNEVKMGIRPAALFVGERTRSVLSL